MLILESLITFIVVWFDIILRNLIKVFEQKFPKYEMHHEETVNGDKKLEDGSPSGFL